MNTLKYFSVLILFLTLLFGILTFKSECHANTSNERDEAYVLTIQDKYFVLKHELETYTGILPLDAFYKGVLGGISYSYHFNPLIAWEVLGAFGSFNINTGFEDDLYKKYSVAPTTYPKMKYSVYSNIIIKPLFGKLAWFNNKILPVMTFLNFGAAINKTTFGTFPALNAGINLRFNLSSKTSLRINFRNLLQINPENKEVENIFFTTLGLSLNYLSIIQFNE